LNSERTYTKLVSSQSNAAVEVGVVRLAGEAVTIAVKVKQLMVLVKNFIVGIVVYKYYSERYHVKARCNSSASNIFRYSLQRTYTKLRR